MGIKSTKLWVATVMKNNQIRVFSGPYERTRVRGESKLARTLLGEKQSGSVNYIIIPGRGCVCGSTPSYDAL